VTVAIKAGTGTAGAVLSGTATVSAVNGVATFSGLSIDKSGNSYQLHATDGALTAGDSSAFNVTVGTATKLAVSQQPAGATGGTAFTTQPNVTDQDAGANTVNTDTSSVTPTTATNRAGTTLPTCTPAAATAALTVSS